MQRPSANGVVLTNNTVMYVKPAAVVTSIGMDQSLQYPIRLYKNLKGKYEIEIKWLNDIATPLGLEKSVENGPFYFFLASTARIGSKKKHKTFRKVKQKSSFCALIPRGKLTLQRGIRQLYQTQQHCYSGKKKNIQDEFSEKYSL